MPYSKFFQILISSPCPCDFPIDSIELSQRSDDKHILKNHFWQVDLKTAPFLAKMANVLPNLNGENPNCPLMFHQA